MGAAVGKNVLRGQCFDGMVGEKYEGCVLRGDDMGVGQHAGGFPAALFNGPIGPGDNHAPGTGPALFSFLEERGGAAEETDKAQGKQKGEKGGQNGGNARADKKGAGEKGTKRIPKESVDGPSHACILLPDMGRMARGGKNMRKRLSIGGKMVYTKRK